MIQIDSDNCNACGLCIKICHESCLRLDDDVLRVDYKFCSTCTQCIAICPNQAITWNHVKPELFDQSLYPDSRQFRELLMQRRTIRDFSSQKIDKPVLEEIANMAIYAPTHNFNLRTIIIDDENIISQIDALIRAFSLNIYSWFYKPGIIPKLIKVLAPEREFEYLKAKPKLENVQKRNSGFKTKPAAIILIIGDKRIPLTLESAQYALYNIDLYAQTKGIACRNLVGNQMILNGNKQFKKSICLTRDEKIFGTIALGFPAVRFGNKVTGKQIRIQWNGRYK